MWLTFTNSIFYEELFYFLTEEIILKGHFKFHSFYVHKESYCANLRTQCTPHLWRVAWILFKFRWLYIGTIFFFWWLQDFFWALSWLNVILKNQQTENTKEGKVSEYLDNNFYHCFQQLLFQIFHITNKMLHNLTLNNTLAYLEGKTSLPLSNKNFLYLINLQAPQSLRTKYINIYVLPISWASVQNA